ncbi:MAG: helix-turn-helix transcriptional regulator [Saprospiraceae bacterium]|nr:helix-turn-helix transcriptional regulator [Saprospiraceae bacterium]
MFNLKPFVITQESTPMMLNRQNANYIVYSQLTTLNDQPKKSQGIGIKYVLSGKEQYHLNGKMMNVSPHQFLLVNHESEVGCRIQSQEVVKGVCLYLNTNMVNDVHRTLTASHEELLDKPFLNQNSGFQCFERIYDAHKSNLGLYVLQVSSLIEKHPNYTFSENLYYQLAENMIVNQSEEFKRMNAINAKKFSTREELYRRLLVAKDFIESNFDKKTEIESIARIANISTFHFFRTFQTGFSRFSTSIYFGFAFEKVSSIIKKKVKIRLQKSLIK